MGDRCTIDLNEGLRRLEVARGDTLLATLRAQGIAIPSVCGGRGICARCKLHVPAGAGPPTSKELSRLTPEELAAGVRLSCQVRVRNDLSVLVPEELLGARNYRGVVERIRDLTYDIKELRIRLTEPAEIEFVSGQYVELEAPACGANPEPVYRAYSMSSAPERRDAIELIIRLVPGGICTTWVFTELAEGDEVTFSGPYGKFRLTDSDRDMVWVAGGSGMAPFWSMVRHLRDIGGKRRCTCFFGAVAARDVFLLDELRALEKELDWFTFVPALSASVAGDEWDGETGLITEVLDRRVDDGSELEAYLCGSPGMIHAAGEVLERKGISPERTFYDEFA